MNWENEFVPESRNFHDFANKITLKFARTVDQVEIELFQLKFVFCLTVNDVCV